MDSKTNEVQELTAIDVADYFLSKSKMSPKKLQKLVYYSYAWFIALNNESPDDNMQTLFNEKPQAWAHGPVFPSLYSVYKERGWHDIPRRLEKKEFQDSTIKSFLDEIWSKFGEYSADELEYMTHQEEPWKKARGDTLAGYPSTNELDDKDIYLFYNSLNV